MNSLDPELLAFDREHLWHPYAAVPSDEPRYLVRGAAGCELELSSGAKVIDAMASWWSALLGYRHPVLVAAVQAQAQQLSHVMFGGLTHRPAIELGRRLLARVPPELTRVFFCDSGSVSVEVALKLARQYQVARGRPERQRVLALRAAYHGDTWGAMSVCDPVGGMHRHFAGALPEQVFLPAPGGGPQEPALAPDILALEETLARHATELCAFILEPVVQNAGGLRFYSADYLRHARRLCAKHDIVLIFDEIATGFHRTGPAFALEHAGVSPDILCLGKALTGGMLSMAAVLTTNQISEAIRAAPPHALLHGPTFMANPLACAAAAATLDVLASSPVVERVAAIESQLSKELGRARGLPGVRDVRVFGAIGVIELRERVPTERAIPFAVSRGVWLRPFGPWLYCMPPLIIEPADLRRVTTTMCELAETLER